MKPWKGDVILKPLGQEEDSEIEDLENWLANRPSATMDPSFEERVLKTKRLIELKSHKRTTVRPPTNMMAAQQMDEDGGSELP